MSQKEIYATIEFVDHEIRFILGEFHNNQLNVLNVETLPTNAINHVTIKNTDELIKDIKEVINRASSKMKLNINKVILLIPSYSMNRHSKRIKISVHNDKIDKDTINDAIHAIAQQELSSDEILVNTLVNRYIIDGVPSGQINFDKPLKSLSVDIDLYSGPKQLVYDYLNIIEKAGLSVLDICFDTIAMATEMALIEASRVKNVINIKYELNSITLSLLTDGRIINSIVLHEGYHKIIEKILIDHHLSFESTEKIVLSNDYLSIKDKQEIPVFLYSSGESTRSISDKYLNEIAIPILFRQFEEISEMINSVLMDKETSIYITGKGASITNISELCSNILKSKVKVYCPEVLGARKSSLVGVLGAMYVYRDSSVLKDELESCVEDIPKPVIKKNEYKYNESEDSMTNRFKELFKINKNN